MPECSFKIGDWQSEKNWCNRDWRVKCNMTRGIETTCREIRHHVVSDGADGVHPVWLSKSAWTEIFFADGAWVLLAQQLLISNPSQPNTTWVSLFSSYCKWSSRVGCRLTWHLSGQIQSGEAHRLVVGCTLGRLAVACVESIETGLLTAGRLQYVWVSLAGHDLDVI